MRFDDITWQAKQALWYQFKKINCNVSLDEHGYVEQPEENLLPGITSSDFRDEIGRGGGSELKPRFRKGKEMKPKFQAVHSSCALAVNSFCTLKKETTGWDWRGLDLAGLSALFFEKKLSTGIKGSLANLDVYITSATSILGIESKLTEYLTPKAPVFAPAFVLEKLDIEPCWWSILEKHRDCKLRQKQYLDVAQLIKHYLGLRRAARQEEVANARKITLLYLFWEPLNAKDFQVFSDHRTELRSFENEIEGTSVRFVAMTYQDLWKEWKNQGFMVEHVERLEQRYNVRIVAAQEV
jgi:hypothetical protein